MTPPKSTLGPVAGEPPINLHGLNATEQARLIERLQERVSSAEFVAEQLQRTIDSMDREVKSYEHAVAILGGESDLEQSTATKKLVQHVRACVMQWATDKEIMMRVEAARLETVQLETHNEWLRFLLALLVTADIVALALLWSWVWNSEAR